MATSPQGVPRKQSWLERKGGIESLLFRVLIRCIMWGIVVPFVSFLFLRATCLGFVDNYQLGYKYDSRTGEITILPRTGYIWAPPFIVSVHHIDLRPMQVCISAIQRVLNCKLVQFNPDPEAVRLFLSWHGRNDYDGPGTSSSTSTSGGISYTYLQSVLLNYAYDGSGKEYPFLKVLNELQPVEKKPK